ncbi:MAG: hypothetical protein QXG00_08785, partial [Candidatus Woesearchaeota archaeon]
MATVVTNLAKLNMISAVSGDDLKVVLLNTSVSGIDLFILKTIDNYYTAGLVTNALSAFEVTGYGYSAGGVSLSGVSAYNGAVYEECAYFDGSSIVWPNSTIEAGGMAVYREGTGLVIYISRFEEPLPKQSFYGEFRVS